MANSVSVYNAEFWANAAQTLHKPRALYRQLANFRAEAIVKRGSTFHRILPVRTEIGEYTVGADIDAQDVSGSDESIVVSTQRAFRIRLDNIEEIQSSVALQKSYGKRAAKDLANVIDSDFLYEVVNAGNLVDDGVVGGGTSGNALSLTGSNVSEAFSNLQKFLGIENVDSTEGTFAVIDPYTAQTIVTQFGERESAFGDVVSKDGIKYSGRSFRMFGMDVFVTNNYTRKEVLSLATQPTNGDTVTLTIGGNAQVFTFVAAIGSTAGNVLIGADVDATRASFEALLNAPGTTSATQVALSGNDLRRFTTAVVAVDSPSGDTLTIYSKGRSIGVAETLTDGTDGFVAAKRSSLLMMGKRGAVDGIVQIKPRMKVADENRNFGANVMGLSLYEWKTFSDGAVQMVRLDVARNAGA